MHLVKRLRGNVIALDKDLQTETTFPEREDAEDSYKLSEPYKKLFRKVLAFASELVSDESGNKRNRRVRWWSALALLRAMASSPAAAAATLRNRAATADAESDVFGYMAASGQDLVGTLQRIHGYLFNAGATEEVFGYMNVIKSGDVFGYMKGNVFASGSVNAYTSGVGFESSTINTYLAGISGNASGDINGFLIGVQLPTSQINGYLIGFEDCDPHGTVPLPPLPTFTIPTGNFINNC